MRSWRVGNISMGALLLFLGLLLLVAQFFRLDVTTIFMAWWPVILVVLGLEILVYLFISKEEKPRLKYDFLSIFFVGIIGVIGIGLTVLTMTGVLGKVNEWSSIEVYTMDLPEYEHPIGPEIKRVVLNAGNHPIMIENSQSNDISIFGTYRARTIEQEVAIGSVKDYLFIKEHGDTLYVTIKEIYSLPQPFQDRVEMNAVLTVPENIELDVNEENNSLALVPGSSIGSWFGDHVANVNLLLADKPTF